jgi:hypothetical protein
MPNLRPFVKAKQLCMILFCYVQNLLVYDGIFFSQISAKTEGHKEAK